MRIKLKQGLNIPLPGNVAPSIESPIQSPIQSSAQPAPAPQKVAVLASYFHGLKTRLLVKPDDEVHLGQTLFQDKQCPDICYTAPISGVVRSINRGHRRALISITIEPQSSSVAAPGYESFTRDALATLEAEKIRQLLLKTGLWTSLRTRPFSKVPDPATQPHSIFITAMDTRPLSPEPDFVIRQHPDEFDAGVLVLSRLTPGKTYVCCAPDSNLSLPFADSVATDKLVRAEFEGPHPAGLVGTHIHFLDPVDEGKTVWSVSYQDVIAIGKLFLTGELSFDRVIALAGPLVKNPCMIRTQVGACVSDLCAGQVESENCRLIAGSVLDGWKAEGALDFLGQDTLQITAIEERASSKLFGWFVPLTRSFSISRAVSWFAAGKSYRFNCRKNGSERAFVPLGLYERVFPLDLLVAPLLRSLLVMDTEMAKELGCLELDEEDLALCSYICPGKHEFGTVLRNVLERIEKDG